MNGYFVTGTDTNVGKTYITCALARHARARGRRVFAFKPIESGCAVDASGRHVGGDQELLAAAAGDWQRGPLRGLYQLPLPAAPLVAAEAAGFAIDLPLVIETARRGAAEHEASLTLVEGAGGWRVPITATADMSALARALGLPILVVARAGLGTINHSLLTIEAVEGDGCRVHGVVLSQHPADEPAAAQRNRLEINRRWPGPVWIFHEDPAPLDALLDCST